MPARQLMLAWHQQSLVLAIELAMLMQAPQLGPTHLAQWRLLCQQQQASLMTVQPPV